MASKSMAALSIAFGANTKGFDRAMKKTQAKMKKFGKGLKKMGSTLSTGLTAPLLGFAALSIKAFDTQAKAEAKLLTALKGRVDVQQKLIAQAKDLQTTTLYGDEATIEAQSMLAMFGLTEEQILMLIPAIQDFASGMGLDLVGATSLVSKSVATSTDALKRYFATGLEPTMSVQEKAITLTRTLNQQFEGQAATAAKVGAGALIQLKNQLGDISEEIGGTLMPHVVVFATKIKNLAHKFDDLTTSQKKNIVKWGGILAAIGPVVTILGMMTIAASALLPVLGKIGLFLAANPFVLLAVAIGVTITKMILLNKEAKKYSDEMGAVKEAQFQANQEIADATIEVELLTEKIKSENTSLAEKEQALKDLQKISSLHYGGLTLAKDDIVKLDNATKDYISTILKEAEAHAVTEKIKELSKERLEIEQNLLAEQEDLASRKEAMDKEKAFNMLKYHSQGIRETKKQIKKFEEQLPDIEKQIDRLKEKFAMDDWDRAMKIDIGGMGAMIADLERKELEAATKAEKAKIEADKKAAKTRQAKLKKDAADLAALNKTIHDADLNDFRTWYDKKEQIEEEYQDSLKTQQEREIDAVKAKYDKLIELGNLYGHDMTIMEKARAKEMDEVKKKETQFNEAYWENFGVQLQAGAESLDEYVKNVKNAARETIGAMIAEGVAAAVSKSLSNPALGIAPWLIPVFAGLAAGLAKTAFNSLIPSFSEGGLVSSPTLAMVGDSPHGPEMIMPINKLKAMMGSQTQNIVVTGRLSGTDIFLSNKGTANNRKRGV